MDVKKKPPRQRRAFSTVGGPVDVAGDPAEAAALARFWEVDPALARALTHGFHSYAGRMHPSIARAALGRYSGAGDVVVDPFCGSGTVLVEAFGLGRAAVGVDASPLGVAIAGTRTTVLGAAGRGQLVAEARRIAEESGEGARKRRRPEMPVWAQRELARFHPHVLLELVGLRILLRASSPPPGSPVGRALRMCFSSILVKLMKAGPEAPRDGSEKRIARGLPSRLFADRADELARGLAALEARAPAGTPAAAVHLGDARALGAAVATGSARLVLSSPPYAGTYDYAAQHDVRFTWLELPRRRFAELQIGARPGARDDHEEEGGGAAAPSAIAAPVRGRSVGGFGADPTAWHLSRRQWLGEMARVLAPGGAALLIVGDGVVGNRAEDTPTAVAAAAVPAGLDPVARASQVRPMHDRRLREIFGAEPRREHLLLLRKRG